MKYQYSEFTVDCDVLGAKIRDYSEKVEPIYTVIGVSRGGLVPAVHISHALSLPLRVIEYSSRDRMVSEIDSLEWLKDITNAVVVSDIADSGHTLEYIKSINPKLLTAVVIQKEMSDHTADFYAIRTTLDDWIYFPWDRETRYS